MLGDRAQEDVVTDREDAIGTAKIFVVEGRWRLKSKEPVTSPILDIHSYEWPIFLRYTL